MKGLVGKPILTAVDTVNVVSADHQTSKPGDQQLYVVVQESRATDFVALKL